MTARAPVPDVISLAVQRLAGGRVQRAESPEDGAPAPVLDEDRLPEPTRALDAPPPAPIAWSFDGWWTAGDVGTLAGEGGTGKSTIALHVACAKAAGRPAFGRFRCEPAPVLFVSQEDPAGVLLNRAEALVRGHGWPREQTLGNLYLLALEGANLASTRWQRHLRELVGRLAIGFVVLDPWAELIAGEENSASEMRPIIKAARALTEPTQAGVMIVHHLAKEGQQARSKLDRVRGSGALKDAMRVVHVVERAGAGQVTLTCEKLSRAPKLPPFVVRQHVETAGDNAAHWLVARMDHQSVREASITRGEVFVIETLWGGARLSSTELRQAAKGSGTSAADVAAALPLLSELRHLIAFEEVGKQGRKEWFIADAEGCRTLLGNLGNLPGNPAGQPSTLPRQGSAGPSDPASPFRGRAGSGDPLSLGNLRDEDRLDDRGEAWEPEDDGARS